MKHNNEQNNSKCFESRKELLPVISFRIKQSNRFISQKSKNPLNYHNMNITILIKHHVLYKAQFIPPQ